ncbi:hypothetical protein BMS3Abin10_00940 [bacterium BMS3Abin10]|nr:hypothetical protein BMS3Abin10_00940 [bacterium BMS3Abin10]
MKTKKLIIALLIIAITIAGGNLYAQQFASIGKGILHILGIGLTVSPEQQTAPINTETAVNTSMELPDIDLGDDIPDAPGDLLVVAELTGPGISERTITKKPDINRFAHTDRGKVSR